MPSEENISFDPLDVLSCTFENGKKVRQGKKSRISFPALFLHSLAIIQEINDWILIDTAKQVSMIIGE